MLIESKLHKEINGNIEGTPFNVVFDSDDRADVEEAVGNFLLRLHAAEKFTEVIKESAMEKINKELKEMDFSLTRNSAFVEAIADEILPQVDIAKQESKKLSEMSLTELKAEASRLGIKIGPGKTQKQIIAKIEGGK